MDIEHVRARARRWYHNHKDRVRSKQNSDRALCPVFSMFHSAKRRAKRYGLEFSISKDDIIIPDTCPVLGIKLTHGTKSPHANSPTLDRIDPRVGYVPGNVVVISHRANRIKSNATLPEIERIVSYIKEHTK